MNIVCDTCNKEFKYYSILQKHLSRKNKCKSAEIKLKCEYCSSIFLSSNYLCQHKYYFCKLIPNDIKEQILLKKKRKNINSINTNSHNNTNNTNIITNNDNRQMNITINICGNEVPENLLKSISKLDIDSIELLRKYIPSLKRPFGYENLDNLMSNEKKIINFYNDSPQDTYRNLLNEIHTIDENRNFAIPNVKHAIIKYINSDLTISKSDQEKYIYIIQKQMKTVFSCFYDKYKSKIKYYYHKYHEEFIEYMLMDYREVQYFFYKREDDNLKKELEDLRKKSCEDSVKFDDRDILSRPKIICNILDYKTLSREIIEDYLTHNSLFNNRQMIEHKENLTVLTQHIKNNCNTKTNEINNHQESRKPIFLEDIIEENKLVEKQKIALEKVMKLNEKYDIQNISINENYNNYNDSSNSSNSSNISDNNKILNKCDIKLHDDLDNLEKERNES